MLVRTKNVMAGVVVPGGTVVELVAGVAGIGYAVLRSGKEEPEVWWCRGKWTLDRKSRS